MVYLLFIAKFHKNMSELQKVKQEEHIIKILHI